MKTKTLEIKGVGLSDSGRYRCTAQNELGEVTAPEDKGGSWELIVHKPILILRSSRVYQSAMLGEPFELTLDVTGYPLNVTFTWRQGRDRLMPTENMHMTRSCDSTSCSGSLGFDALRWENAGLIDCDVTNGYTSVTRSFAVIATEWTHGYDETILDGSSVRLPCKALLDVNNTVGSVEWSWIRANYTWSMRNSSNTCQRRCTWLLADGSLELHRTTSDMGGKYRCQVYTNNENNSMSSIINVAVSRASNFTLPPQNVTAFYHEQLMLYCNATQSPKPFVEWFRNGARFIHADDSWSDLGNGSIMTKYVHLSDEGYYACHISNIFGSKSRSFRVTVYAPPIIEIIDLSAENDSILIKWRVISSGGLSDLNFTVLVREATKSANQTKKYKLDGTVFQLVKKAVKPGAAYQITLWAMNQAGASEVHNVELTTPPETKMKHLTGWTGDDWRNALVIFIATIGGCMLLTFSFMFIRRRIRILNPHRRLPLELRMNSASFINPAFNMDVVSNPYATSPLDVKPISVPVSADPTSPPITSPRQASPAGAIGARSPSACSPRRQGSVTSPRQQGSLHSARPTIGHGAQEFDLLGYLQQQQFLREKRRKEEDANRAIIGEETALEQERRALSKLAEEKKKKNKF